MKKYRDLRFGNPPLIAAEGTKFAQLEVARGIFPPGGAAFRGSRHGSGPPACTT